MEDDKDKLFTFCEETSRSLTWFIGKTAYGFIITRKPKKLTEEEKMHKLLLHSKLVSGGIENRFINLFSKDTLHVLKDIVEITKDSKISEFIEKGHGDHDDELISNIIYSGTDSRVDKLIYLIHKIFCRKVIWGRT